MRDVHSITTLFLFRLFVLAMAGLCSAIVAFTASAGVVWTTCGSRQRSASAAAAGVAWLGKRPGFADAVARAPRAARVAFIAEALAAAVQLVWLTVFIADPGIAAWTGRPWQPMTSRHSCVSAYSPACGWQRSSRRSRGGRRCIA